MRAGESGDLEEDGPAVLECCVFGSRLLRGFGVGACVVSADPWAETDGLGRSGRERPVWAEGECWVREWIGTSADVGCESVGWMFWVWMSHDDHHGDETATKGG
jgi:hypothetical protein